METTKPTVVFVHGAWADNSGFDGSIRALRGQGFRAIGASNPLRDLRSDAAYVAVLLRSIEGPIVMVGHSYGGAVSRTPRPATTRSRRSCTSTGGCPTRARA